MREIIKANSSYLNDIMELFDGAKAFMRETGNMHQWNNGYPSKEVILNDIKSDNFYLVLDDDKLVGCFYFYIGEDITYNYIEGDGWLQNDTYGTIHRIASLPSVHNVLKDAVEFTKKLGKNKIKSIRVDTHADNKVMQHVLTKNGFTKCGIIYLINGDPRFAYELVI